MNQPKTKNEILQELLNNPAVFLPPETTLETNLYDDLGMDSLDIVEMAMGVEKQFHISIGDDQLWEIKTVGDLVTVIESKTNKAIV